MSATDHAKRALVSLLIRFAKLYAVILDITRDSVDADIRKAFKKMSRKCHPDRGGNGEHQQAINDAYSAWGQAERDSKERSRGRKPSAANADPGKVMLPLRQQAKAKKDFRFQSAAVLLTYQKFDRKGVWEDFVAYVRESLCRWKAKFWCATMETNTDLTFHLHLSLQFHTFGNTSLMDWRMARFSNEVCAFSSNGGTL